MEKKNDEWTLNDLQPDGVTEHKGHSYVEVGTSGQKSQNWKKERQNVLF